jgi:hypothetical protein
MEGKAAVPVSLTKRSDLSPKAPPANRTSGKATVRALAVDLVNFRLRQQLRHGAAVHAHKNGLRGVGDHVVGADPVGDLGVVDALPEVLHMDGVEVETRQPFRRNGGGRQQDQERLEEHAYVVAERPALRKGAGPARKPANAFLL